MKVAIIYAQLLCCLQCSISASILPTPFDHQSVNVASTVAKLHNGSTVGAWGALFIHLILSRGVVSERLRKARGRQGQSESTQKCTVLCHSERDHMITAEAEWAKERWRIMVLGRRTLRA